MNPFAIVGGEVRLFTVRLKEPFITALGRRDSTTNVELRLRLAGGARGRGEASGSVVYAHQKPARLARVLRRLVSRARGRDTRAVLPLARETWREAGHTPAAACAFECAALDALLKALRIPMAQWFGGALDRVESDCTLSAASAGTAAAAARRAADAGFRVLKVKVGSGGPAADLARVLAAHEAAPRAPIQLDGNQGLTASEARRLVEGCLKRKVRLTLLEQPLPRDLFREAARLKRDLPIPLAADESVRSVEDARRVLDLDAADVLNIKLAKTGIQASLEIMALERSAGKRLMIGCMAETAAGLSPGVHLACGTGAFSFVDLDSDFLLVDEQPRGGWRREGAWLVLG